MPIRMTSLRVASSAFAQRSSFSTVSLSIRTRIIVSFGLSDFGLPVDGDTVSPHFLSLQLLYVVATRMSTPPAKKITNNSSADFNCPFSGQSKSFSEGNERKSRRFQNRKIWGFEFPSPIKTASSVSRTKPFPLTARCRNPLPLRRRSGRGRAGARSAPASSRSADLRTR